MEKTILRGAIENERTLSKLCHTTVAASLLTFLALTMAGGRYTEHLNCSCIRNTDKDALNLSGYRHLFSALTL